MTHSDSRAGAIILVVIVAIVGIIFTIGNSINVGDVEGKPFSVEQTSAIVIGPGTWIYYDEEGQEQPLNCSRLIVVTCDSEDGRIHFTTTLSGKNNVPLSQLTGSPRTFIAPLVSSARNVSPHSKSNRV